MQVDAASPAGLSLATLSSALGGPVSGALSISGSISTPKGVAALSSSAGRQLPPPLASPRAEPTTTSTQPPLSGLTGLVGPADTGSHASDNGSVGSSDRERDREQHRRTVLGGAPTLPSSISLGASLTAHSHSHSVSSSSRRTQVSEAYKIVTELFQKTLLKFGDRMPYTTTSSARRTQAQAVASAAASVFDSKGVCMCCIVICSCCVAVPSTPAISVPGAKSPTFAESPTLSAAKSEPQSAEDSGADELKGASAHILDANLVAILENLHKARQFEVPDIGEEDLVSLIEKLLQQHGR